MSRSTLSQIISGFFLLLLLGAAVFYRNEPTPAPTLGAFGVSGGQTYYLNASIGTTDSTIHLSSFKEPVSNIPYTMAYLNTDVGYFTIDPQTSRSEFGSFTGITQNANGSADVTGVQRGLSRTPGTTGCVASSTLAQSHAGRSVFILSNSPCFYEEYATLRNTATVTAPWIFTSTGLPKVYTTVTDAMVSVATGTLATVSYVNSVAIAGASNASMIVKGIVELATQSEAASSTAIGSTGAATVLPASMATDTPNTATRASRVLMSDMTGYLKQGWLDLTQAFTFSGVVTMNATTTMVSGVTYTNQYVDYVASSTIAVTVPVPIFVATSTNAIWASNTSIASTTDFLGFVYKSTQNNATSAVQISGVVSGFTGLTKGLPYYVQDTAGTIGTTMGTAELYVGTAVSATQLLLDRKDGNMQFLGSQTCSVGNGACTIGPVQFARFAIVFSQASGAQLCGGPSNNSNNFTMFVAKKGGTTASFQVAPGCGSGNASSGNIVSSAVFNANGSVTVTNTPAAGTLSTLNQTAYFYR